MDVPAGGLLEDRLERAWFAGTAATALLPSPPPLPRAPAMVPVADGHMASRRENSSSNSEALETSSEVAESIGSHVRRALAHLLPLHFDISGNFCKHTALPHSGCTRVPFREASYETHAQGMLSSAAVAR